MAKAKGTIETELRKIEWCLLLILEDLFLVPLDAKEHPVLLDIIEKPCQIGIRIAAEEEPKFDFYTSRLGVR